MCLITISIWATFMTISLNSVMTIYKVTINLTMVINGIEAIITLMTMGMTLSH